jgi:ATP-dependent helicase HrpB
MLPRQSIAHNSGAVGVKSQIQVPVQDLTEIDVMPLYGAMPRPEQDRALEWNKGMPRRIILATGIAETSLSVPGVRAVVDFGLSREPCFEAGNSGDTLKTVSPLSAQ